MQVIASPSLMASGSEQVKQMGVVMYRVVLMLVVLLVGCGNQGEAEKKLVEKVNITGQVFVVTKGRENIKLALVDVVAIPEKELSQYIKSQHDKGIEQQTAIFPRLELAKKAASAAAVAYNKCAADYLMVNYDYCQKATISGNMEVPYIWILKDKKYEKAAAYEKTREEILYYDCGGHYFEKLPMQVAASKTDADGKFNLSLPHGKYALAAKSSRDASGTTENYYWLVWVDTTSPNHSVMLSNDNLFETKCKECASSNLQLTEKELAAIEEKVKEKAIEKGNVAEEINNKKGKAKEKAIGKADDSELDELQPNWKKIVQSAAFRKWLKEPPATNNFDSLSASVRSELIENYKSNLQGR